MTDEKLAIDSTGIKQAPQKVEDPNNKVIKKDPIEKRLAEIKNGLTKR